MPSSLRSPRAVLVAAGAPIARSAAGVVAASAPALPPGQEHEASARFEAGTPVPTLTLAEPLPTERTRLG